MSVHLLNIHVSEKSHWILTQSIAIHLDQRKHLRGKVAHSVGGITMKRVTIGIVALAAGLSGCASARVVQKSPDSVVVSIPEKSDVWPTHYLQAADALAKQELGTAFVKTDEREVVTGGPNSAGPTSTIPPAAREFRITYMKKPPVNPLAPPYGSGTQSPIGMRPPSLPGPGGAVTPAGMGMGAAGGSVQPVGGFQNGMSMPPGSQPMNSSLVPPVGPPGAAPSSYPYSASGPVAPVR